MAAEFGQIDAADGFFDRLYAALLPIGTLTLVVMAHMMRMTRAAVLNVMSAPYIETALLKAPPPAR